MYPDGPKALPPELAAMTDRLHFTGNEEADRLLVEDPFALLVGFALDQQVPVQKAFMGPYVLRERLGTLDAARGRGRRPRPDLPRAPRRSTASRARWRPACTSWRSTSSSATTATRRGCGRTATTTEELRDEPRGAARLRRR